MQQDIGRVFPKEVREGIYVFNHLGVVYAVLRSRTIKFPLRLQPFKISAPAPTGKSPFLLKNHIHFCNFLFVYEYFIYIQIHIFSD